MLVGGGGHGEAAQRLLYSKETDRPTDCMNERTNDRANERTNEGADGGNQLRRVLGRELYDNSTFLLRFGLFVWGLPGIVQWVLDKVLNKLLTKVAFPFTKGKGSD